MNHHLHIGLISAAVFRRFQENNDINKLFGDRLTDRQLAYVAYHVSGIPHDQWEAHFACDMERPISTRPSDKLTDAARTAYRAIVGPVMP